MLAGAGFGNDAGFAHAPREQHLADTVVDLVRACVIQVFALEVDFCAAEMTRQPLGKIERTRPADIMRQQLVKLGLERRIIARSDPGLFEIEEQRHQCLGNISSAEGTEMPRRIRAGTKAVGRDGHGGLPADSGAITAPRAALMNAAILSRFFRPGVSSTPDDASTKP